MAVVLAMRAFVLVLLSLSVIAVPAEALGQQGTDGLPGGKCEAWDLDPPDSVIIDPNGCIRDIVFDVLDLPPL